MLRRAGHASVACASDGRQAMELLARERISVVITDLGMPHIPGETLLQQVSESHPDIPVIVLTARNEVDTAVRCMQAGAADYLVKPVDRDRLLASLRNVLETRSIRAEAIAVREGLLGDPSRRHEAFGGIQSTNQGMVNALHYLEVFARSSHPVLITGETGVGKELAARAVHDISGRKGPFVTVNVGAVDDTLFADTLFGHARGGFTDARDAREGQVASAAGGTLFLDEIGTLSDASQVKLLRLLQTGDYLPVGSDRPRQCSARILAATNIDVARRSAAGEGFRRDLYFRLQAHHVALPPLRKRPDDIPRLGASCLEAEARRTGRATPTVPPMLFRLLQSYDFPGNVRELENMCQRAVALHERGVLSTRVFREMIAGQRAADLGEAMDEAQESGVRWLPDPMPTLQDLRRIAEDEALRRAGGNQAIAAGMLGVTRQALNQSLAKRGD
jgi:DNA-binding NtrC family response regulator